MAPTLTSNSFLLTTPPHSRLTHKNQRLTVFAKKAGSFPSFRLGKKPDDDALSEENDQPESSNPFKLNFDFGKVTDVKSLIPIVSNPTSGLAGRRKDASTVFVAGATGQAGVRIAQSLLREGFSVRAGVPDLGAAQELARLAANYKIISIEESKRLNAVESSFQDAESIAKAIGNASKAVVTIGPAENGPTGEVTTADALQVIQGAQLAGVSHVTIIYDESPTGTTNNVLDGISLFFNNLFLKSQPLTMKEFLEGLVETDVRYTLIKTKLTEDFSPESSYNIVVSAEGSVVANNFKVTNSKIASLVAAVFSNTAIAENKVVEVSTDPEAASKPVSELFSAIPEDGRRAAYADAIAKAKSEEIAKRLAPEASRAARTLEEGVKKFDLRVAQASNDAEEAEVAAKIVSLLDKAKGISSGISWQKLSSQLTPPVEKPIKEEKPVEKEKSSGLSWQKLSSQFAAAVEKPVEGEKPVEKETSPGISWLNLSSQFAGAVEKASEKPKVQVATVRGQAKARNLPAKKAVTKKPTAREVSKTKAKQTEQKTESRKIFGGLFQQETIYIDD